MKGLYVLLAIFVAVNAEDYCSSDAIDGCAGRNDVLYSSKIAGYEPDQLINCNANYSGFSQNVQHLQSYANENLVKSFDYLLLASNFGTYVKNRPGFEKQFRHLSDNAWENAIKMIKHITKRGGTHDFKKRDSISGISQKKSTLELNEINALAFALDVEKTLAIEAHRLHERYSHANHPHAYDAEIAHFLEEEYIKDQAEIIRRLSGYTNDLKHLIKDSLDTSLSVYLFDEYLQKQ